MLLQKSPKLKKKDIYKVKKLQDAKVNLLLKKENYFLNLVQCKCTVSVKFTVVHSNVLGLRTDSPLTHWRTQSKFLSCKLHSW